MSATSLELSLKPAYQHDNPLIPANKLRDALFIERKYIYEAMTLPRGEDFEAEVCDPIESLEGEQPKIMPDKKPNYCERVQQQFAEFLREHYTEASIHFMHSFKQLASKAVTEGTDEARWDLLEFLFRSGYSSEDASAILKMLQALLPTCGSEWLTHLNRWFGRETKSRKENEELFQCILHKTPTSTRVNGSMQPVHIEIRSKLNPGEIFQSIQKISGLPFNNPRSTIGLFCILLHIIKNHIKLTKENKKIVQSLKDMNVLFQTWNDDTLDPDFLVYYPLSYLVQTVIHGSENAADFFLKHYRFNMKDYLVCLREAIKNANIKLVETILKHQATDSSWESKFLLMLTQSISDPDKPPAWIASLPHGVNLRLFLIMLEVGGAGPIRELSYSPLSFALRRGANWDIIQTLLKHRANTIVNCQGHTIDVTEEISKLSKEQEQRKITFLLPAFKAKVGEKSPIFTEFVQSPISDSIPLTRLIFSFM